MSNAIGEDACKALPGLHAFTGRDSVSAFAGIRKLQPLKLVGKNKEFQSIIQNLGEDCPISPEFCKGLESFVCTLYSVDNGTQDVNECRYAVFCAKKCVAVTHQLPPNMDCCQKHFQSANYQIAVLKLELP